MRKNVEMIERKIVEEKVTWIACDGAEFTSEIECANYEDELNAKTAIQTRRVGKALWGVGDINEKWFYWEDVEYFCVEIRNEEDVEAVNNAINYENGCCCNGVLSTEDIGTIQVLARDSWGGDLPVYVLGDAEELRKTLHREADEIIDTLIGKRNADDN